jgi:hypothetical protein
MNHDNSYNDEQHALAQSSVSATHVQAPDQPDRLLKFFRHLVLVILIAGIHPFWALGASYGFSHTAGTVAGVLGFSALITGLAKLFFTEGTGRDWQGNFIRSMWAFTLLMLAGQWYK